MNLIPKKVILYYVGLVTSEDMTADVVSGARPLSVDADGVAAVRHRRSTRITTTTVEESVEETTMVLESGRVCPPTTVGDNSLPVDVPFADEDLLTLSPGDALLRIVESEKVSRSRLRWKHHVVPRWGALIAELKRRGMSTSEFAKVKADSKGLHNAYFYRQQLMKVSSGAQSVATAGDAGLQTNLIPDSNQSVQTNIAGVVVQTNIVSEAIATVSPPGDGVENPVMSDQVPNLSNDEEIEVCSGLETGVGGSLPESVVDVAPPVAPARISEVHEEPPQPVEIPSAFANSV